MSGALEQTRGVWTASALALTLSWVGTCALFGAPARAADPACASPICLTPMNQSIVLMGQTIQSTAKYVPLSIWNMGGGNFDIAFDFPLLPVPVTLAAAQAPPSVAPINLNAVLKAGNVNPDNPGFGGQYGGAAKNWSFVGGAGLQNGTLDVTAYQAYAGPDPVGIFGSKDPTVNPLPEGFAVQVPADLAPTPPKGTALHWVQVIADNYKNPSFGGDLNTGYGKSENIVDVTTTNKTPYYDLSYTADSLNFFDAPSRDNQANLDQSDWWIAQLFLAAGPAANAKGQGGQVTLYSPGIQWGWANLHISVPILNAIPALLQAFAFDTSSLANFDVALDCLPVTFCPLNDFVTTSFLAGLDADFLATPVPGTVPEPQTWAMAVLGFAGLGLLGLRRKRDRHGRRIVAQQATANVAL